MKGLITRTLALSCGAALLAAAGGCCTYENYVDPCWPQRYVHEAKTEVNESSAPQIHNGHVLDQTVWNWMFERGCERLTPAGVEHLAYLARRRPQADCTLYLQTANDLPYDQACPDHLAGARQELDARRVQAIQKHLVAHTAGRPVDFQVLVHDPSDPSVSAVPVAGAIPLMYARWRGGLPTVVGGASGGGGAAGGGGGPGR